MILRLNVSDKAFIDVKNNIKNVLIIDNKKDYNKLKYGDIIKFNSNLEELIPNWWGIDRVKV